MNPYFILDIETCPNDTAKAKSLEEEKRLELLNPIDSRIVAIGLRHEGTNYIFDKSDETALITDYWTKYRELVTPRTRLVGFNISDFDMPFLIMRSFIHNIPIVPLSRKEVIDLREKLNFYSPRHMRGKLKEIAKLCGIPIQEQTGADVLDLCISGDHATLRRYLERDLEITDLIYQRAEANNITKITRF